MSPGADAWAAFARAAGARLVELRSDAGGATYVAPELAGRVMASVPEDAEAAAWVNPPALASLGEPSKFHNVGGQDRFWIGPEGGAYGFFFDRGAPSRGEYWRAPASLDAAKAAVVARTDDRIEMRLEFALENQQGRTLRAELRRTIVALGRRELAALAGAGSAGVAFAGARAESRLTARADSDPRGVYAHAWHLGQFAASPRAFVVAPFTARRAAGERDFEDRYFGAVPAERLHVAPRSVCMRADGGRVTKIGIAGGRTPGVAGAWMPERESLILQFFGALPPDAAAGVEYANNLWDATEATRAGGDAFQSYNSDDRSFFELESASPARFLKPGDVLEHAQTIVIAAGPRAALAEIAERLLDADLDAAERAFA